MKITAIIRFGLLALVLSAGSSYAEGASSGNTEKKSKFSIGFAYIGGDSIYSNVKFRSTIMPSISYKSETLTIGFFEGLTYKFFNGDKATISAGITPKGRPYKSTRSASLTGMKRDMYYDGSLTTSYKISRGLTAKLKLATEVTNKFNGKSADLSFSQFVPIAGQPIIFQAGAKWYGSKHANYLYGVDASEVTFQRAQYAPGSVTVPYLSINTFYPITKQTSLFANANVNFLPSNVVNSPIVDDKSSISAILGLNYSF